MKLAQQQAEAMAAQKEKELTQQLQAAQFEVLTQRQQLSDHMVENQELQKRLEDEEEKGDQLQNELLILQAKRYIVETCDIEQVSDARLSDIEAQLFRSFQEINMEKGRRQMCALMANKKQPTTGTTDNSGTSSETHSKMPSVKSSKA